MFEHSHKAFPPPEDENAPIWRYMDFTQFVFLLEKQRLHFTRPDQFGDRFEGAVPRRHREMLEEEYAKSNFAKPQATTANHAHMRKMACVNCWHANSHESVAMWQLYLKSDEGIAVRSSYARLTKSFDCSKELAIHAGMVRYIDYEHDDLEGGNLLSGLMHKRKSFEYEREMRAVAYGVYVEEREGHYSTGITGRVFDPSGLEVPVDLSNLIEAVYVSPIRQKWFTSLVESVVKRYGWGFPVRQSDLAKDPVW